MSTAALKLTLLLSKTYTFGSSTAQPMLAGNLIKIFLNKMLLINYVSLNLKKPQMLPIAKKASLEMQNV